MDSARNPGARSTWRIQSFFSPSLWPEASAFTSSSSIGAGPVSIELQVDVQLTFPSPEQRIGSPPAGRRGAS
jgi:hypothetical protein